MSDSVADIDVDDYAFTWEYKDISNKQIQFELNFNRSDSIS